MRRSDYDRFTGDDDQDDRLICDGCNVLPPHEHRCQGARAQVDGEVAGGPCECPACQVLDLMAALKASLAAGKEKP